MNSLSVVQYYIVIIIILCYKFTYLKFHIMVHMVHDWLDLKCKWMCSFNHYKMRLYNHIQQTQHIGSYEQNHKIASQLLQKCSGLWSQQIILGKDYGLFNKVWKICINESVLNIFSGIWNLFLIYNQALWFSITDTFAITDHGNIYFLICIS